MGTSTRNSGQRGNTPLVPSWLNDNGNEQSSPQPQTTSDRFSNPRGNFTRFINNGTNGGATSNLHNATSNYIRSSLGGSNNATLRLGAARTATTSLFNILGSFSTRGISETSTLFKLGDIIGKTASEALLLLIDFVCPDGGATDEGIARDAYIEAIVSTPEFEGKQIEELTPNEYLVFLEIFMAKIIEDRLLNDIGNKLFLLPDSVEEIDDLEKQLNSFIKGSISDAMTALHIKTTDISTKQASEIVDSIYQKTYDILAGIEE